MFIKDIMTREVLTVNKDDSVEITIQIKLSFLNEKETLKRMTLF